MKWRLSFFRIETPLVDGSDLRLQVGDHYDTVELSSQQASNDMVSDSEVLSQNQGLVMGRGYSEVIKIGTGRLGPLPVESGTVLGDFRDLDFSGCSRHGLSSGWLGGSWFGL